MKLATSTRNWYQEVPGVVVVDPLVANQPAQLTRTRHGANALRQARRVLAIGDKAALIAFATLNGIEVTNYNELYLKYCRNKQENKPQKIYNLDVPDIS